jgi:hypothetical protein
MGRSARGDLGTRFRGAAARTVRTAAAFSVLPAVLAAWQAGAAHTQPATHAQPAAQGRTGAAHGRARWHIQRMPDGPGSGSSLASISCTSARACTAVGYYDSGNGNLPLAERWNGTRWAVQRMPRLSGFFPDLRGVSCPAARECVAVGGGFSRSLAELWTGSRWTVQHTPDPNGTQFELTSVACPGPADCIAVGGYQTPRRVPYPLAMRWNGRAWRIVRMPLPPDIGLLVAVSCAGPSACTAVGNYSAPAISSLGYAERWNGHAWTLQLLPTSGHKDVNLTGVSCPTARFCLVTGGLGRNELTGRWNGSRWSLLRTPVPPHQARAQGGFLTAASCHSARLCVAAGWYVNSHQDFRVLAERWNGTRWVIQRAPSPSRKHSELNGVSCPAARTCTAVGDTGINMQTLAERNSGE